MCVPLFPAERWGMLVFAVFAFYFEDSKLKNVSIINDMGQNERIWVVKIDSKKIWDQKLHSLVPAACLQTFFLKLEISQPAGTQNRNGPHLLCNSVNS